MGGQQFGARAYADNFTRENVLDALQYAHFYEKRLYLTVNTLMKERRSPDSCMIFCCPFMRQGWMALSCRIWERRLLSVGISRRWKCTEHADDDRGCCGRPGGRPPRYEPDRSCHRELSLKEIRRIKEETGLEIEVFVHGALCYCYSGQCLLSSMYGEEAETGDGAPSNAGFLTGS